MMEYENDLIKGSYEINTLLSKIGQEMEFLTLNIEAEIRTCDLLGVSQIGSNL